MHKQKVSRMLHEGFFLLGTQKEFFWGMFVECYFSRILQMPTYLISFIDN
jgi:hypothetical protein